MEKMNRSSSNVKRIFWSAFALLFFVGSLFSQTSRYYWAGEHISAGRLKEYEEMPFNLRRAGVISELKEHANNYQAAILGPLHELEGAGSVSDIRQLWICNVVRFSATPDAIDILKKNASGGYIRECVPQEIELYNPDELLFVPPPGDSLAWGVVQIGAPAIWTEYGIDGTGVLVAVLDSGVDFGSPDLADALWINPGEIPDNGLDDDLDGYIDDWRGYDFTEDDGWPHDERGHGTHVSGTIAGRGILGFGTGVAPGCTIMPLKILNSSGFGEETQVWEAIQFALDRGARVMNMSIGWRYSSGPDRGAWRAAVEAACAAGVVMCIAGGNEGGVAGAPNNLRTPGDVPGALTVGATKIDRELAGFSSVGPVAWDTITDYWDYPYPPGLIKPDICAPGDSVPSIVNGGKYEFWDGTSMACPHVAGAAALLIQLDTMLTHNEIKAVIESSAVDYGPVGKDSAYGSGFLDLPAAFAIVSGFGWVSGSTEPMARIMSEPSGAWVESDPTGYYSIELPAGDYNIAADAFGFDRNSAYATVVSGDTTVIDLPLTPGVPSLKTFIVRDFDTGDPIPTAGIIFENWPIDTLFTDSEGKTVGMIAETDPALATALKPGYISDDDSINIDFPDTGRHVFYLHRAEDFEADSAIGHWGHRDDWEWGTPSDGPPARSGSALWGTRLDSAYTDTCDGWLGLGAIDLSGDIEEPMLVFWQWFELEATSRSSWDGGNIKASTHGGAWEIIDPIGGYPSFINDFNPITGDQPGFSGEFSHLYWHEVRFSLEDFVGDTVELAVQMGSDNNTTRKGWFIDDLALIPRTKRGPIFRAIDAISAGSAIEIAGTLFAVTEPVDTSSVMAHYFGLVEDSIRLGLIGEFVSGEIPVLFPCDTVFLWLSAFDISGRAAVYPPGAPDSVIAVPIEGDTVSPDTLPPEIERQAYWPVRLTGLDSTRLAFLISDESPIEIRLHIQESAVSDSLFPTRVHGDTVVFHLPVIFSGEEEIMWVLGAEDTAGNRSFDSDTIVFSDDFYFDLRLVPGPVLPETDSPWLWRPDSGWTLFFDSAQLAPLAFAFFDIGGNIEVDIVGDYDFSGAAGAVILLRTPDFDTISPGIDTLSSENPFYPDESGFTGSGDLAATLIELPPDIWAIDFIPVFAGAGSCVCRWTIERIGFRNYNAIHEIKLPERPSIEIYPNPFNGFCRISVAGLSEFPAYLNIFDVTGRFVRSLEIDFSAAEPAASITWDGRDENAFPSPSGIYLITLKPCNLTKKVLLLK